MKVVYKPQIPKRKVIEKISCETDYDLHTNKDNKFELKDVIEYFKEHNIGIENITYGVDYSGCYYESDYYNYDNVTFYGVKYESDEDYNKRLQIYYEKFEKYNQYRESKGLKRVECPI